MPVVSFRPLHVGRKEREHPPSSSTWASLTSPETQDPFWVFERLGRNTGFGLGSSQVEEETEWGVTPQGGLETSLVTSSSFW